MESSILNSTKKILGIGAEYTPFDLDILTHINSTFSILDQLGVGPEGGFFIEDSGPEWDALGLPANQLNLIRTYVFLRVRLLFDPPTTSFLLEATKEQLQEYEYRISLIREGTLYPLDQLRPEEEVVT